MDGIENVITLPLIGAFLEFNNEDAFFHLYFSKCVGSIFAIMLIITMLLVKLQLAISTSPVKTALLTVKI